MEEENKQAETCENGNDVVNSAEDYIAALKELKTKTVDKAKYDKLEAEHKKLVEYTVNEQRQAKESKPEVVTDARKTSEIVSEMANGNTTNLKFWKDALEYRSRFMQEYKRDPFVTDLLDGQGNHIPATDQEVSDMEKLCKQIKSIIDNSEENPDVFNKEVVMHL